ncbi:MAG: hypothetical protein K6E29_02385 [Cyanobacteria bacterium RUI128]|nr:hypothetical protein [Cyanobacteria bacterium RUI128]
MAQYMSIKAQRTYCEQQDTRWNNLATAMEKKLGEQTKAEEKWGSQYDSAEEAWNDGSKELKLNGNVILAKQDGKKGNQGRAASAEWSMSVDKFASKFASRKVPKYDPKLLEEYTDLDMEYGTMVATYDALLEALKAQEEGLKSTVSEEAQDTHILGGS